MTTVGIVCSVILIGFCFLLLVSWCLMIRRYYNTKSVYFPYEREYLVTFSNDVCNKVYLEKIIAKNPEEAAELYAKSATVIIDEHGKSSFPVYVWLSGCFEFGWKYVCNIRYKNTEGD